MAKGDKKAPHGEKMIEIKLRFWTNSIAADDLIRPKHAWTSGVVRIERNDAHGLVPGSPKPFHSLLDIGAVVEKTLIEHGVTLLPSDKMKKYLG